MSDWDAARYHRVSDPQRSWGLKVLERLAPSEGERILDIGCGTGRLTSDIHDRFPSVKLAAIDKSQSMLAEASRNYGAGIAFALADATRLPFEARFDAVFSTATFHWVPDHALLFAEIRRVLHPGGRLVSQAGGGPNLARLYHRTSALARERDLAPYFEGWKDPWTFAGVDETRDRLNRTGFINVHVWLEPAPTTLHDAAAFTDFVSTVCLRHQLDRLPVVRRGPFVRRITEMAAADDPAYTLDYWRLNIDARK